MELTKQKKTEENPVISPLANEKTYGERVYSRVVDWGLNYWTNLLASAGFSQWAEHGTKPVKLPFIEAASPRQIQKNLADWISKGFFMKGLYNSTLAEHGAAKAAEVVAERSMARARSLTLLTPGFAIMVPAVWLGAKVKPAIVEWLNRRHYGDEAMNDPSLQARHQALAAEERPTFLGTMVARFGTAAMVQVAAQTIGSNNNKLNKLGKKLDNEFLSNAAIDPITEKIGYSLGGAVPQKLQTRYNAFAQRHGLDWSNNQIKLGENSGIYNTATQDLGRFIAADTVYTLITAMLISPFVKILRFIPGMSYKPKVAANSPTFDGEKISVPKNRYADVAPETLERSEEAANEPQFDKPTAKVSQVRDHATLAETQQQKRA